MVADAKPAAHEAILDGSALDAQGFRELFESQLISRHLDLMARVLRVQNKVFTIGSSGHEGNAMVARCRAAYRSGLPALPQRRLHGRKRFRKLPGMDPIMDSALSFAASAEDPRLRRPPQGLGQQAVIGYCRRRRPSPRTCRRRWHRGGDRSRAPHRPSAADPRRFHRDCSFGDASANHATAQTAFNAASWTVYQKLPAPVLYVCEDNGIGISVKTPTGWIGESFRNRPDLDYFFADGLDLANGYGDVLRAVEHCRRTRRPTFLHLRTTRIMGHAGTDFEIEWRSIEELVRSNPAIRCCAPRRSRWNPA